MKKSKKKHKRQCTTHTGPRGGKFVMVRKKGGGTRRQYVPS